MTEVVYQTQGTDRLLATRFDLFQTPISGFVIGDEAGYVPTDRETNVRGTLVFQGGPEHVRTKLSNNNRDLTLNFIIPEGFSEIAVGNLLAYSTVNGRLQPVVALALSEAVFKREILPDEYRVIRYPGNRLMITIKIALVDITDTTTVFVQIIEPDFSVLPFFGNIADVPPPAQNPYNQFVVNRLGADDHAAFVMRGDDNAYWTQPLWQNVNSPKYGIFNALEGPRDTWLWGGLYTDTSTDLNVHGGLGYTDSLDGVEVIAGAPYKRVI